MSSQQSFVGVSFSLISKTKVIKMRAGFQLSFHEEMQSVSFLFFGRNKKQLYIDMIAMAACNRLIVTPFNVRTEMHAPLGHDSQNNVRVMHALKYQQGAEKFTSGKGYYSHGHQCSHK